MNLKKVMVALGLSSAIAIGVAACGGGGAGGANAIKIDGSSTVAPLSESIAEAFQANNADVNVTVGTSGTGGGFEKFCAGETDISDASRPIKPEEAAACKKSGIAYDEIQVANDGIALVVSPQNDFADCLTVAQLKKIWDKGSTVNNWKQVDLSFPDTKLELFGPGTDSGTFDFFTASVNGVEDQSRSDYNATEDDNVTVEGVSGSEGGLGYFGLSYAEQNSDKVKIVGVDSGSGCVKPSTETVQTAKYTPLSRPLFVYPSRKALERPEVKAFVKFYESDLDAAVKKALFVPMTDAQAAKSKATIAKVTG
jgi:phosphate transport system substrate-binding protein